MKGVLILVGILTFISYSHGHTVSKGIIAEPRFAVFAVVEELPKTAGSFQFVDYVTQKVVRGYYSPDPVFTTDDLISVRLKSMELYGAPVTGLSIKFNPNIAKKSRDVLDRKTKRFLIVVNYAPVALASVNELEAAQRFFVTLMQAATLYDFELLTNHARVIFGDKFE